MTEEDNEVEISNAKEEISEIVEKCNKCGLCKEIDPIFRITREEALSLRGRATLFSKKIYEKEAFDSTLSGICRVKCPFRINMDEAVRKARKILNLKGKEHPANKKMLEKIQNNKNPFLE